MTTHLQQIPAPPPAKEPRWQNAFADLPREHGFERLTVSGSLPRSLTGTMVRNGPSLYSSHGRMYDHWFDGDGGISAVRFTDTSAWGAMRLVQSRGLSHERRAGTMLYGGYGTKSKGLWRRLRGDFKNAANTSVLLWNDQLFALHEAGLPTALDPETLETLGETDLQGVVLKTFSAHPHRVPRRRAGYNFGVRYGRKTILDLYELADSGAARRLASLPLEGASMIHDFVVTENHLVFFVPPLRLRKARLLLGLDGFCDSLAWRPEYGTDVIVVPIDEPHRPRRFKADAFYQWHFANAFERDGDIVVDFVSYPDFRSSRVAGALPRGGDITGIDGTLRRAVLHANRDRLTIEELCASPCEFPRFSTRLAGLDYRYCYVTESNGTDGFNSIARIDVRSGALSRHSFAAGQWASEPVFVPRAEGSEEDDGWVLVQLYDAASHRSSELVFDARAIGSGPLATVHFGSHVPPRLHGMFSPATREPK